MATPNISKLLIILAAAVLAFFIIKPFITPIVFAAVVAYLIYPAHTKLSKKISEAFSRYLLTFISAAVVIFIVAYGASLFLNEISKAYLLISKLNLQISGPETSETIKNVARLVFSKIIEGSSSYIVGIPKVLLSFFILFISLFYFLKDGKKISGWAMSAMPLDAEKKRSMASSVTRYTRAFVYVWSVIALLQGIVAGVGFYLFGINYVMLGVIAAATLSFLPIIGPYALYTPIGAIMIFSGDVNNGVGLLAYGLILGSILDYVVRPYLAGRESKSHPLLVLLGILGGLSLIGPAGIIAGPILLLGAVAILEGINKSTFK